MSEKPTILIADDEPGVVAALAREARRAGLSYITDTTSSRSSSWRSVISRRSSSWT
jgi:hypothetical protein